MISLEKMLVSGWQNYYHFVIMVVGVLVIVSAFYLLKKKKNHHEEETETPIEIHPRGETLPFHTPPLETNVGGIVEEAVTPEVATAEKNLYSHGASRKRCSE